MLRRSPSLVPHDPGTAGDHDGADALAEGLGEALRELPPAGDAEKLAHFSTAVVLTSRAGSGHDQQEEQDDDDDGAANHEGEDDSEDD
jgi:hypothetical protein